MLPLVCRAGADGWLEISCSPTAMVVHALARTAPVRWSRSPPAILPKKLLASNLPGEAGVEGSPEHRCGQFDLPWSGATVGEHGRDRSCTGVLRGTPQHPPDGIG